MTVVPPHIYKRDANCISRHILARHKAIIAYLSSTGLTETCATFRAELGLSGDFIDDEKMKKYEGLLERKWTSVVRLQKKVLISPKFHKFLHIAKQ